ncbi:hybrid sensor histidine kinase/response regulator [Neorhodopirellula pilleata]|uniref:histidine kinase n=1 Tax=Neorhodopirellula pilleata TaxID=2714738 RepID=A0A5C6AH25_9BACT|nr:response regulator [Neorhodopirellula pilleata]TWT98760.1 Aerobic respiration control sensor protein ArcB [Neorhodopirellula pilleata]
MNDSINQDQTCESTLKYAAIRLETISEMDHRNNELLATLGHELRNPLAPIKNGLQLLAMMDLGEDAEKVRSMMARQVKQIVRLVDDLVDISRISCGKVLLDKQVFSLIAVVEAAIEESSILISENNMTLEVIDNSDAACVCGDLSRLTQVICNLLNNSAKYGSLGGQIVLTLDASDGFVFIRVRDNGMGIATDRLENIFGMYEQVESADGLRSSGLGIGLALVRSLVKLHGGVVDAESDGLDCGSTFTVRLPLATGILIDNVVSKGVSDQSLRHFRVLVVDDVRAMRFVTQQLLEKLGHEVQVAENGRTALEILDSFHPDVIFSDLTMPVMGGHELARRIRQRKDLESVCLVALSGYGQSSDRELAFKAGFDRHLTKPVDFQRLQDLFNELD